MSRALCASLFAVLSKMEAVIKGKKIIVSRVEMDHNRHVDAGEQCFAASCHLRLNFCLAFCRPIQCGGGC